MTRVSRAEFEKLQAEQVEFQRMLCAREFERKISDGEPERIAAARGIDYQDAWTVVLEEAYRPDTEATRRMQVAKQQANARRQPAEEERIDAVAQAYVEEHNVSYDLALDFAMGQAAGPVHVPPGPAQTTVRPPNAPITYTGGFRKGQSVTWSQGGKVLTGVIVSVGSKAATVAVKGQGTRTVSLEILKLAQQEGGRA